MLFLKHLLIGALLFCSHRLVLRAESPEMWVVPLEHKIPTRTPNGHIIRSLTFVLRIRGGEDGNSFKVINLYSTITFKLFDAANRPIEDNWTRDTTLDPAITDLIILQANRTANRCYSVYLMGDALIIPDQIGGRHEFKNIHGGKLRLEITFDDTVMTSEAAKRFEFHHDTGAANMFFRGPKQCGAIEIEIEDNEVK